MVRGFIEAKGHPHNTGAVKIMIRVIVAKAIKDDKLHLTSLNQLGGKSYKSRLHTVSRLVEHFILVQYCRLVLLVALYYEFHYYIFRVFRCVHTSVGYMRLCPSIGLFVGPFAVTCFSNH